MLTQIKQWLCSHRYDLADLSDRDKDGMVSCRCHKCGAVHRATHGLALPGSFDRNTPIYIAPAALTVTGLMNLVRDYADAFAGVDMKDALVKYEVVRDYATRLAGPAGNAGVIETSDEAQQARNGGSNG